MSENYLYSSLKYTVRRFKDFQRIRVATELRIKSLIREGYIKEMEQAPEYSIYMLMKQGEKVWLNTITGILEGIPIWTRWLKHVHGVGVRLAGVIVGEIGDVTRFPHHSHLVSYAGISRPKSREYGDIRNKRCNLNLKTALYNLVMTSIKLLGRGTPAFYGIAYYKLREKYTRKMGVEEVPLEKAVGRPLYMRIRINQTDGKKQKLLFARDVGEVLTEKDVGFLRQYMDTVYIANTPRLARVDDTIGDVLAVDLSPKLPKGTVVKMKGTKKNYHLVEKIAEETTNAIRSGSLPAWIKQGMDEGILSDKVVEEIIASYKRGEKVIPVWLSFAHLLNRGFRLSARLFLGHYYEIGYRIAGKEPAPPYPIARTYDSYIPPPHWDGETFASKFPVDYSLHRIQERIRREPIYAREIMVNYTYEITVKKKAK